MTDPLGQSGGLIYGLEAEALPDGVTPLEAIAVVKCLDQHGEVELWTRTTGALNAWERLGMLEIAAYSTKRGLQDGFEEERTRTDGPKRRSDQLPKQRLYQCPGCWSFWLSPVPAGGWIECDCGEAATCDGPAR